MFECSLLKNKKSLCDVYDNNLVMFSSCRSRGGWTEGEAEEEAAALQV